MKIMSKLGGIVGYFGFMFSLLFTVRGAVVGYVDGGTTAAIIVSIVGTAFILPTFLLFIFCARSDDEKHKSLIWHSGRLLLIGGVPILLLCFVTMPSLVGTERAYNESGALETVRDIIEAQQKYQAAVKHDDNEVGSGEFATYEQLVSAEPRIWDDRSETGSPSGYVLTVDVRVGTDEIEPGFAVTAVPEVFERSGKRSFFGNESGIIYYTIDGSVPDSSSMVVE